MPRRPRGAGVFLKKGLPTMFGQFLGCGVGEGGKALEQEIPSVL